MGLAYPTHTHNELALLLTVAAALLACTYGAVVLGETLEICRELMNSLLDESRRAAR